jgi:hypothetical protein
MNTYQQRIERLREQNQWMRSENQARRRECLAWLDMDLPPEDRVEWQRCLEERDSIQRELEALERRVADLDAQRN